MPLPRSLIVRLPNLKMIGITQSNSLLVAAVQNRRIVAALDVFDDELLPMNHPLCTSPNMVLTPHLGFDVEETWVNFYPQSVENVLAFLDDKPIRIVDLSEN